MILLFGILGDFSQCSKSKTHMLYRVNMHLGCCDSLVVDEGIFIDGLYDELERYLGGQGVAVLDHWLSVGTIPTVHCRKGEDARRSDARTKRKRRL